MQADWNKLDSFHIRCQRRILQIRWHDFVFNDEVLHRTGLFDVSYIVRKRRLCLFGHVARLRRDVPANQILQICTKTRDGERPSQEWRRACGRPSTTWTHQICRDTGVTATEALQLAEDRPFWRTITTAGGSGWKLRVTMMMMMCLIVRLSLFRCPLQRNVSVLYHTQYTSRLHVTACDFQINHSIPLLLSMTTFSAIFLSRY